MILIAKDASNCHAYPNICALLRNERNRIAWLTKLQKIFFISREIFACIYRQKHLQMYENADLTLPIETFVLRRRKMKNYHLLSVYLLMMFGSSFDINLYSSPEKIFVSYTHLKLILYWIIIIFTVQKRLKFDIEILANQIFFVHCVT